MQEKNKECWCCEHYSAYYTKGYCKFDKQNTGFCRKHKMQIEDKHHTCGQWRYNYVIRQIRKEIALKSLIEVLQTLETLRVILEEEHEENKINPI